MSAPRLAPLAVLALITAAACAPTSAPTGSAEVKGPEPTRQLEAFDPKAAQGPRVDEGPPEAPTQPVAVLDYGPRTRTQGGSNIHVRFNQPMVALQSAEAMGEVTEELLTIKPALKGKLRWRTPDLLLFEPTGPLRPSQRYEVALSGPIKAPGGGTFLGPLSWSFETARVKVAWTIPEHRTRMLRPRTQVAIAFTQAIGAEAVRGHLSARAWGLEEGSEEAKDVKVHVRRPLKGEFSDHYRAWNLDPARAVVVVPVGGWPRASRIEIGLDEGLAGDEGPLPMGEAWSMGMETYPALRFVEADCSEESPCRWRSFNLTFSTPLNTRQQRQLQISPPLRGAEILIDGVDPKDHPDVSSTEVVVQGPFVPEEVYTLTVGPDLRDIFGQRLGERMEHRFVIAQPEPLMGLSAYGGTMPSSRATTIGVNSRHVQKIRVRSLKLSDERLLAAFKRGGDPLDVKALSLTSDDRRAMVEQIVSLPLQGATHWSSQALDLVDLMSSPTGSVFVEVERETMVEGFDPSGLEVRQGLFQVTDLGVEWVTSKTGSLMRVTRLSTGAPVVGAKVEQWWATGDPVSLGKTDADGLLDAPSALEWPLPSEWTLLKVQAPKGGDRLLLSLSHHQYSSAAGGTPPMPGLKKGDRVLGRIVTERGVYRPGEPVHFVGWTGVDTPYEASGLAYLPRGLRVQVQLLDRDGRAVETTESALGESGKFHGEFTLPKEGGLGQWGIKAEIGGVSLNTSVKVRHFRTPEFKVEASASKAHALYSDQIKINASASYYFGGQVHITEHRVSPSCHPITFRPDGLGPRWQAGLTPSHWYSHARGFMTMKPAEKFPLGTVSMTLSGAMAHAPYTNRCAVTITVQDDSFQEVVGEATFTVHPDAHYLAVETPSRRLEGEPLALPVRAVDHAGARVAAEGVQVRLSRTWWAPDKVYKGQRATVGWKEHKEVVKTCALSLKASGEDAVCEIKAAPEGSYTIKITQKGSPAQTEAHLWVAPRRWGRWLTGTVDRLQLHVGPGKDPVQVGQQAAVIIRAPVETGRGVLLVERAGLRERHPFELSGGAATLRFEVPDAWTPQMHFRALLTIPSKTGLPTVQQASATLQVRHDHRRLHVEVEAPRTAAPRDAIQVSVKATGAEGRPVSGRVALWATDEAVLSLTRYQVPDLIAHFLPHRQAETWVHDSFAQRAGRG